MKTKKIRGHVLSRKKIYRKKILIPFLDLLITIN